MSDRTKLPAGTGTGGARPTVSPTGADTGADARARRAAQTEFERPVVVEAGAGTGKTATLIARLLAWSLGQGWEEAAAGDPPPTDAETIARTVLRGVVAITFTEAAAAEMAARFAAALVDVAEGRAEAIPTFEPELLSDLPAEEAARRAEALLAALDHLTAQTIHAFCLGLLAEHPLDAGLHPQLVVDADGSLVREAARELLLEHLEGAGSDPLAALLAAGTSLEAIERNLADLAAKALPAAAFQDPWTPEAVGTVVARLREAVEAFDELAGDALPAIGKGNALAPRIGAALDESRDLLAAADALDAATFPALRDRLDELWPARFLDRLGDWSKGKIRAKAEREALAPLDPELAPRADRLRRLLKHVLGLDPEAFERTRRALAPLVADLATRLRSRGVLTFEGLLRETRTLLERRPAVRRTLRRRIRQLLVDEFQDTSSLQCRILELLALGAKRSVPSPGLFLVADPKQSIYGWRSADLAAYDDFLERVRAAGGAIHVLSRNFRSARPILSEVDRVIGPVMREAPGVQPPFRSLAPCPARAEEGFDRGGCRPVEHWRVASGERRLLADEVLAIEASHLAAEIRRLHDAEEIAWSSVAILLRSSTRIPELTEALRRRGVPYTLRRDREYYRRREITDATALVSAVVQPGDHLALVAFLRSPLIGVPDAALIPLWRRRFPERLTRLTAPDEGALTELAALVREVASELPADIPGLDRITGWEELLIDALARLATLRQVFREEPADRFVERLRLTLLPEVTEAARYLGRLRLANLARFFRSLERALIESSGDARRVVAALRRAAAERQRTDEPPAPESGEDAVQVLTIHSAKGLEFDHVYLPQLHATSGSDERPDTPRVEEMADGSWELALLGLRSPGFDRVERRRATVEAAERVRTLYVAMTRARRRLVLTGKWAEPFGAGDPTDARSYADLLDHRGATPPSLEALVAAGAAEDDAGCRWRLLAEADEPSRAAARPSGRSTSAALAESLDELDAARAVARRRMARPWKVTASSDRDERLLEPEVETVASLTPPEGGSTGTAPSGVDASRWARRVAGDAIHRALELWDLSADPDAEADRQRAELDRYLDAFAARATEPLPAPDDLAAARALATATLDRFLRGPLFEPFLALAGRILAHELPCLVPPSPDTPDGPVGCGSGTIDLLYRDNDGRVVVADFKTDHVDTARVPWCAAAYARQMAFYRDAVRQALDLAAPPKGELWFVWAGRVHSL